MLVRHELRVQFGIEGNEIIVELVEAAELIRRGDQVGVLIISEL